MISIASRDAFGGFTFAAISAKNVPVVVTVKITASLIESSMFFFPIKAIHLLYRVFSSSDLKYITSLWFNRLFMDDLSYLFVIRTKYTNACGKDSKYTNVEDISLDPKLASVARLVVTLAGMVTLAVTLLASLLALLISLLPFLASFKILPYNIFI